MRLLILLLLFQGSQEPIPIYPGDPDTGQHKGQPIFCQNFSTKEHSANCDCHASQHNGRCKGDKDENGPDSYDSDSIARCKVHCRKDSCKCSRQCET